MLAAYKPDTMPPMKPTPRGPCVWDRSLRRWLLIGAAGAACALPAAGQTPAQSEPAPTAQPVPTPPTPPAPAPTIQPLAEGAEVEVVFKDGSKIAGMFVKQTPERVILNISGIETSFTMDTVDRVRPVPSVEERYRELRAVITDDDVEQLLRLSDWLRARGRLDLALWEVDHVLELEPANPPGKELRTLILQQQLLNQARVPGADAAPALRPEPTRPAFPLLTPEQINVIRVFEVDLKDAPRMIVPRDTMRRFLDKYAGRNAEARGAVPVTPEAREIFYRQKPVDVLGWMFDLRTREFYPEVQVLENPRALKLFRDTVHNTWIINSCATNRCHGGEEAGRLYLYNKRAGADATVYTNFLILDRFRTAAGLGLIDYAEPAKSPLLDMALPREVAVFKHPEVGRGKWKPVFTGSTDDRYQQAIEWIRSMYPQRTGYPIEYTPPKASVPPAAAPVDAPR